MTEYQDLDWANDPVTKLRKFYNLERESIAHFSASDVAIEETHFSSGMGLKFTPEKISYGTDILYFHGGGWIVGSPWTHKTLCSWLARFTERRVYAAPYALAPENKFPKQANQASEITNSFLKTRDKILLAGDSAGGAMVLWAAAGVIKKNKILGIASFYGAFGCTKGTSHQTYGDNSVDLKMSALFAMYAHLGCEDPSEFQAKLSLSGAPLLLVKAECDPIADDNDWLAQRTIHPVTHMIAKGQAHAYLQECGNSKEADASMRKIANWINNLV